MAKLPDLTSLGARPTPQPSTAVQGYETGQMEQAVAGVGQTIAKVGEQIQQSNTDYNTAQAKAYMARASIDASTMFDKDQDYPTFEPRYLKNMQQKQQEAAAMITDPRQRKLFQMESQVDVSRGLATVKRMATQKEADYGRGTLENNLIQNSDTYVKTPLEGDRVALANSTKGLLQSAVQKGWIDPDTAVKRFDSFRTDVTSRSYDAKMAVDPEAVVKELAPVPVGDSKQAATVVQTVQQAAQKHGADPDVLAKTMMIESRGNPNAVSPTGAKGAFQFTGATASQYGLTNRNDLAASADAAARLQVDNVKILKSKGVEPTGSAIYLAHQQGASGAAALLQNPDKNAVDVIEPFKKNRDDAVKQIVKNGGTVDMTAGEFTQKWTDTFDKAEGPSHIFEATNSVSDMLPADVLQKKFKSAADLAIQNAIAQNPEKVDELLARPEFKAAFPNPADQEKIKATARTAFAAKDENARVDRMMGAAQTNQTVYDSMVDGKLTNSKLAQMQANGQVTDEFASYMRTAMQKNAPKRSPEEQAASLVDFNVRMNDFNIKKKDGKTTSTGTAEDYLTFQRDVVKSMNEGYLTEGEAQGFLKTVSVPLAKRVDGAGNGATWYNPMTWGERTPYQKGYEAIRNWTDASKLDTTAKAEVMRRYALALNEVPDDQRGTQAGKVAKAAIEDYRRNQFPVLQMMDELPNAVINTDTERHDVTPQTAAKAEAKVGDLYKVVRDKNGNYAMKFTDGRYQDLTADQAQSLKAKGF